MQVERARRSVVAVVLVALSVTGCSAGGSAGSCAAKTITLSGPGLHPGGEVQLSVDWMTATCEDTGGVNRAAEDIAVAITPTSTGEEHLLGTVPTASGPRFTAGGRFDLPDDLPVGQATLTVASDTADRASAMLPVTITAD